MEWFWLAIVVLAVVAEAATAGLVSIWLIPGALVAMILAFFGVDVWIQLVVFLVLSIIGILCFRKLARRFLPQKEVRTNVDSVMGEKCVVCERIDNLAGHGQVKVKGTLWAARALEADAIYEEGAVLTVVAVEGVKLICKE